MTLGQVLVTWGFGGWFEGNLQSPRVEKVHKQEVRVGVIYQRGSKYMWVTVPSSTTCTVDTAEVVGDPRRSIILKVIAGDSSGHIKYPQSEGDHKDH